MTDGIFGLGTMQGENQDKGVVFSSVFKFKSCVVVFVFVFVFVFVLAHVIVSEP
jgi:hypothetical protein